MSRSFKKNGIINDKGLSRGDYNRRFRRVNRQRINAGQEPKLMYELTNPYEVCDFIMHWDKDYYLLFKYLTKSERAFEQRKRAFFKK